MLVDRAEGNLVFGSIANCACSGHNFCTNEVWFDLQNFNIFPELLKRKIVDEMSVTDHLELITWRNVTVTSGVESYCKECDVSNLLSRYIATATF